MKSKYTPTGKIRKRYRHLDPNPTGEKLDKQRIENMRQQRKERLVRAEIRKGKP